LAFTKGLDLNFDAASIFGGDRSKRYALLIEDGAVKEAHVESDNTGLNGTIASVLFHIAPLIMSTVSAADKVL
jgi:2-Cys peroxiredoxin 5